MKKITIGIPIIGWIIMMGFIVACNNKKTEPEKPVDDFLNVPTYETTAPAPTPQIVYVDRETKEIITDSTYWYVTAIESKTGGGRITWHGTVTLPTQYFDFMLARKEFEQAKGNLFFDFIIKINRESARSYDKYTEFTYNK